LVRKGRSEKTISGYCDHVERIFAEGLGLPLRELGMDPARVADKHDEITKEHRPYMANFPNYRNISRSFRVRCQALDEPRNPWRECRLHYPTRAS
jgi:hypothetical protein